MLKKMDAKWSWSEKYHKAFEELKSKLTSDLFLTHFDLKLEKILETNTSEYEVTAVLQHKCKDVNQKAIAHASRTILSEEK